MSAIGLLDPTLLLDDWPDDTSLRRAIDDIVRLCRRHSVRLPEAAGYWSRLWSELGRPLERAQPPATKRSLQQLRQLRAPHDTLLPPPPNEARVWGFCELFGTPELGGRWEDLMAQAALSAAHAARERDEEVLLLVRRLPGRNLHEERAGQVTLARISRWRLHLQQPGIPPTSIPCVSRSRQLEVPWTQRLDPRLPAEAEGARYPFCPPPEWWLRDTTVWRTMESRPAWIDAKGNGWARPSIEDGSGYHWDVFLPYQLQEDIGLSQINVVEYGAPADEGPTGSIHHVPADKKHALRDRGWSC